MGPFKLEDLNRDPYIAKFKDFYSNSEVEIVKRRAEKNLRSPPYNVRGRTAYYTSQRVSKRLHLTEEQFPFFEETSARISLATKWVVRERDASDEYQIINYGAGGQIDIHVDYWNEVTKIPLHNGLTRRKD